MVKKKVIKQKNDEIVKEVIEDKRKSKFEVILLILIVAPFILLTLLGNVNASSSKSGNQNLTNSWQSVSPALPTPYPTVTH